MPEQHTTAKTPLLDSKPRGANRSTKVAGKLKVLPEQPENLPILGAKTLITKPTKDYESVGTTGDSEDGDIEESEESQGDVEVCRYYSYIILHPICYFRCTIKFPLYRKEQLAGTH
jgi:hypothetical protein